jgi:hypothetical protein
MGRNGRVHLLLAAIVSVAAAGPASAAAISVEGAHGRITLDTGTKGGDCRLDGSRLVCADGERVAVASLEAGCVAAEGGALCKVATRVRGRAVTANATETEITCGTGTLKGSIFLLTDNDGKGICDPTYDSFGRVNGGSCFRGRDTCAVFDCDHGCGGASLNCGCHIKGNRVNVTASN